MVRVDPVAFRIGLLDGAGRNAGSAPNAAGGAMRQAAVLKRAAPTGILLGSIATAFIGALLLMAQKPDVRNPGPAYSIY